MNKSDCKIKCSMCSNYMWVARLGNEKYKHTTYHCKLKPEYFISENTKQPKWCPLKQTNENVNINKQHRTDCYRNMMIRG